MFITTANTLDRIPRPLQDRMEIIRIAGYTELEKLSIAKKYLLDKQKEANGLTADNLVFTDNAILGVVRHYTKEAGFVAWSERLLQSAEKWRSKWCVATVMLTSKLVRRAYINT
jgi:ATP-dependent Lon protease